jgi:hypothetical protein
MLDHQDQNLTPAEATSPPETASSVETNPAAPEVVATPEVPTNAVPSAETNGTVGRHNRHADAGRKGAHRVHQLIELGKLYETEHGLKRGRQRLRQLIELGKLYEKEHGVRTGRTERRGKRLPRMKRDELLATLLQCLVRIAKPSFRTELLRLAEVLRVEEKKTSPCEEERAA